MTGKIVTDRMRADKCLTASRGRSNKKHRNYSNKYTRKLGQMGYPGIDKDGYFTKLYSYGVVGHCCIGVQAWFIWCGLTGFVPKGKGYIWNTNTYRRWLKSEPTIKGYGKVDWTTDRSKAKLGAVCFKGDSNKKNKTATHTCIFLYNKGDYVYTVNFNVTGKHKGKRINNGVVKKYHKSRIKGFANMPYPKAVKPSGKKTTGYKVGKECTCQKVMNIREKPSTKSKIVGRAGKGSVVIPVEIHKTNNGTVWIRFAKNGWICAKTPKNVYLKQ